MTRDASLEILKEKLTEIEFRKVATQGYSDVSLSVMAESSQKDARNMADTLFSVTSVNKLCDAYKSGVIDERDLNHIMEFARFQKNNEKYLGDMLDSITSHTMYHASAADTFVALAYEECTYVKAVEMIQNRVLKVMIINWTKKIIPIRSRSSSMPSPPDDHLRPDMISQRFRFLCGSMAL